MITVKTKSGFEAEVNPRKVVDVRFLDCIVKVSQGESDLGKLRAYLEMIDHLFSSEEKARFLKHLESLDEEGIVELEATAKELEEIMTACAEENKKVKNS